MTDRVAPAVIALAIPGICTIGILWHRHWAWLIPAALAMGYLLKVMLDDRKT